MTLGIGDHLIWMDGDSIVRAKITEFRETEIVGLDADGYEFRFDPADFGKGRLRLDEHAPRPEPRMRHILKKVEALLRDELKRGYVLTYEPGAGALWRKRHNDLLGEVEEVLRK